MSTTKHTPGPWFASDRRVSSDDGTQLASCMLNGSTIGNHIETDCANARLIAAAPDLSDALKAFPAECDYPSAEDYRTACLDWFKNSALPALTKAEGAK